jgi:hypothetical protein
MGEVVFSFSEYSICLKDSENSVETWFPCCINGVHNGHKYGELLLKIEFTPLTWSERLDADWWCSECSLVCTVINFWTMNPLCIFVWLQEESQKIRVLQSDLTSPDIGLYRKRVAPLAVVGPGESQKIASPWTLRNLRCLACNSMFFRFSSTDLQTKN